mmetsp:Transcript_1785/g.6883  ORF Transcript_1785/g.6883 Transcript_1785/m.6883 type:complete len:373 (+) Transcript_1785:1240-2358(+)
MEPPVAEQRHAHRPRDGFGRGQRCVRGLGARHRRERRREEVVVIIVVAGPVVVACFQHDAPSLLLLERFANGGERDAVAEGLREHRRRRQVREHVRHRDVQSVLLEETFAPLEILRLEPQVELARKRLALLVHDGVDRALHRQLHGRRDDVRRAPRVGQVGDEVLADLGIDRLDHDALWSPLAITSAGHRDVDLANGGRRERLGRDVVEVSFERAVGLGGVRRRHAFFREAVVDVPSHGRPRARRHRLERPPEFLDPRRGQHAVPRREVLRELVVEPAHAVEEPPDACRLAVVPVVPEHVAFFVVRLAVDRLEASSEFFRLLSQHDVPQHDRRHADRESQVPVVLRQRRLLGRQRPVRSPRGLVIEAAVVRR